MRNYDITSISGWGSPILSAFFFLMISMVGFFLIGPIVGFFVASLSYDGSMVEMVEQLQDSTDSSMKGILNTLQGFATGVGLILLPALYIKFVNRRDLGIVSPNTSINLYTIIISVLVVFSFMILNSVIIEWNMGLHLPEALSGVEDWMKEREDAAADITKMLTTFNSTGEFLISVLVIAILPAVGEELVFRGYLQTELSVGLKNPHIAIWVSAILFSAIHMQFFGFFPRMLLGALFGYLYLWSGNLLYPIIAHFVNNGGQLLILYLVQRGTTDIDMDNPESFPPTVIIVFALVTFGLLYGFRKISYGGKING